MGVVIIASPDYMPSTQHSLLQWDTGVGIYPFFFFLALLHLSLLPMCVGVPLLNMVTVGAPGEAEERRLTQLTAGNFLIGIDPQNVLSSLPCPIQQKACLSPSVNLVQWPTLHGRDISFSFL